jgi:mRNA interferase MazF
VREICLVRLDKTRPALVLTREAARVAMTKVTVAPITTTIKGVSIEVLLGPDNGLDHECVVALDNVLTVPVDLLGRTVGHLNTEQEAQPRAPWCWPTTSIFPFLRDPQAPCEPAGLPRARCTSRTAVLRRLRPSS